MLHIPCPWCGERPHDEFSYGGDATVHPPQVADNDHEWVQYLYFRSNPLGLHQELWHHRDGCRQWLRVTRDTRTHVVHAASVVAENQP